MPKPKPITITLTDAERRAIIRALGNWLDSGDYRECLQLWGSAQGVKAAERAMAKLREE